MKKKLLALAFGLSIVFPLNAMALSAVPGSTLIDDQRSNIEKQMEPINSYCIYIPGVGWVCW